MDRFGCALFLSCLLAISWFLPAAHAAAVEDFQRVVRPLLDQYCVACHSGDQPSGDLEFESVRTQTDVEERFESWAKALDLIKTRRMPPEDEQQPTDDERRQFENWYQLQFVDNVAARPAPFRPRRLSASEYRNTLRSLLGFDLEIAVVEAEQTRTEKSLVLKLLPTDPPGKSGFRNDTRFNPLTTLIWDQYSYLASFALEQAFSSVHLEAFLAHHSVARSSTNELSANEYEQLIRSFVPRALRRTMPENELEKIVSAVRGAEEMLAACKTELKVIMMSPAFLYRGLLFNGSPGEQSVDDFELAERLSYFIWGDTPDAELMDLAGEQQLGQPQILAQQVTRLLDSPKSINLADDFAVQWLSLADIEQVSDETPLVDALKSQPIDFVHYLFTEDRPLIEIIDSRTTFANSFTKKFYGIDGRKLQVEPRPKGIEIAAFVSRQDRITLDGDHFYIDLVFYHMILKCFVLIDLKIGKLTHQDLGQLQLYVNYYNEHRLSAGDQPTLGLILCTDKNDAVVKYTLGKDKTESIFTSRYKLYLPSEAELKEEIQREVRHLTTEPSPTKKSRRTKKQ